MELIQSQQIPRWYQPFWNPVQRAFVIHVCTDYLNLIDPLMEDDVFVEDMRQTFHLDKSGNPFFGDFSGERFGFSGAIQRRFLFSVAHESDYAASYSEFSAPVPRILIETDDACEGCESTGNVAKECAYCVGSGKKTIQNWREICALYASLKLFFDTINPPSEMVQDGIWTSAKESQLVSVVMTANPGIENGFSVDGCFGLDLAKYVNSVPSPFVLGNVVIKRTLEAMEAARERMWKRTAVRTEMKGLKVGLGNGTLSLVWPGHNPDTDSSLCAGAMSVGQGCGIASQNVSTPLQSLTFLAGLFSFAGQVSACLSGGSRCPPGLDMEERLGSTI